MSPYYEGSLPAGKNKTLYTDQAIYHLFFPSIISSMFALTFPSFIESCKSEIL